MFQLLAVYMISSVIHQWGVVERTPSRLLQFSYCVLKDLCNFAYSKQPGSVTRPQITDLSCIYPYPCNRCFHTVAVFFLESRGPIATQNFRANVSVISSQRETQKCCGLVYIERFSYLLRYSDLNLHLTASTSVAFSATTCMAFVYEATIYFVYTLLQALYSPQ